MFGILCVSHFIASTVFYVTFYVVLGYFVLYYINFVLCLQKKFSSRCRKKIRHLISTQKIVFCLFIFSFIATKKKHVTRKSVQSKTKGKFLHLRMLRVARVTHPPSDNQLIPAYSRSFPSSLLRSPPTALARGFRKSSSSSWPLLDLRCWFLLVEVAIPRGNLKLRRPRSTWGGRSRRPGPWESQRGRPSLCGYWRILL